MIDGAGVGLIYGLVGIGYCVIYNATGIVNFAQGVFVMLGGMLTYTLLTSLGLPMIVAVAIAIPLVGVVGVVIEWFIVKPMLVRNSPMFAIILATLAVQIMIERITIMTAGDQPRTFHEFTAGGPLRLGPVAVGYQLIWVLVCSVGLVLLLTLFFKYTRIGNAVRACAQNRDAAALLGIPVARMLAVSFALSAALGAIAGILITPSQYTAFNVGVPFGVSGFIAAIVGGFGSASGAFVGGIVLGVAQAVAIIIFGAGYKTVAALAVLLLVLLLFPSGLLGKRSEK
ncbi:MAG: branched-chain amino acid ABC transporter permease [Proteobacteria bacterium]|nr:branched-chain amino acid ABC transporter permease [Pseudomonadota bacterium]